MSILFVIIHVLASVALIMIVLLQSGKGADMGVAFGGGASQTLFGSTGASSFFSKATTIAAIVFMITSLSLAYMSGHRKENSIMNEVKAPVEEHAQPAVPVESAPNDDKNKTEGVAVDSSQYTTAPAGPDKAE